MHAAYLTDIRRTYRNYRQLAERAIAQVDDEALFTPMGSDDNSIAVVMQHVAGNLRSRFRDFLTSDGEKPDRHRDGEFQPPVRDRAALLQQWNGAWDLVLAELDRLTPESLEQTVYIRREPFLVVEALNRSVAHTAYHVGQVVFLAKHVAGAGVAEHPERAVRGVRDRHVQAGHRAACQAHLKVRDYVLEAVRPH